MDLRWALQQLIPAGRGAADVFGAVDETGGADDADVEAGRGESSAAQVREGLALLGDALSGAARAEPGDREQAEEEARELAREVLAAGQRLLWGAGRSGLHAVRARVARAAASMAGGAVRAPS